MKAEILLRVRIALSQGVWLDSQAQNGEDNVPTVKSEDVGNTESDTEDNAQHTGPVIERVRVNFATKSYPEALEKPQAGSRLQSVRPPQPSSTAVFEVDRGS